MKKLIQEATRFQKLANIKEVSFTDLSQERPDLQIPQLKGGIVPPDIINTPDEKAVKQALEMNNALLQKMARISNVNELDGYLKIMLDKTTLNTTSKSSVLAAFNKVLKDLAPNSTTISTDDKKGKK